MFRQLGICDLLNLGKPKMCLYGARQGCVIVPELALYMPALELEAG